MNFSTMNFRQMYNVAWVKLQSDKQRKLIDEITWSDLHWDYLNFESAHLKRDSVLMWMNKLYSVKTKFFIFRTQSKKNTSQRQFDRLNQSIDDLMRKLKTLTLTINALLKKIIQKKQFRYSLMRCLKKASASFFSRSYFDDCFRCDVADHLLRYCSEIWLLCDKKIIHICEDEKVCWNRSEEDEFLIRALSSDALWKNKIMCQMKKKKVMLTAQMKVNIFIFEATVSHESQKFSTSEVQIKNILICKSDQEFNNDDINKEYFDMNYTDKLNVLIIILYSDK